MTRNDPILKVGEDVCFDQFLEGFPDVRAKLARYKEIVSTPPPKIVRKHFDKKSAAGRIFPFSDTFDEPSEDYLEKQSLESEIICSVREIMLSGNYEASGVFPNTYRRVSIEPDQWKDISISPSNWLVGQGRGLLTNVRIQRSGQPNVDDQLYERVLDCLETLSPSGTTKSHIKELMTNGAAFEISKFMFERAWERALQNLPQEERRLWTKAGRRRN